MKLSLLDNFAWGNPNDEQTLGRLEAACRACHDAALAFGAPFVSGKDSLYNVFVHPDGRADPVAPTLVITAVAPARHPDRIPITGVVQADNDVWLVGPPAGSLRGSHFDLVIGEDLGGSVPQPEPDATERHLAVADAIGAGLVVSAHDPSEGGIAVAAAEWAFAGRRGLRLELAGDPHVLFGEGPGRYLVEVRPGDAEALAAAVPVALRIGTVTDTAQVEIGAVVITLDDIESAWKRS